MITKRTVALIGNPNAGKTTLFNQLTGAKQRVGNWAGVTVERKEGFFTTSAQHITLVDLPGAYSLTTLSQQSSLDEQIACRYILERQADILINVVDAGNLERNLYLTLQLLELGVPCIVALNMLDIACTQEITIDIPALERCLGCPVIPLVSSRAEGIETLKARLDGPLPKVPSLIVEYPTTVRQAMEPLLPFTPNKYSQRQRRWLALHMLEGDIHSRELLTSPQRLEDLRTSLQQDAALAIADARYATIIALCQAVSNGHLMQTNRLTARLDAVLLNRWFGVPLFFMVMYIMFILAINFGGALQPLFEGGSSALFIDGTQWLGYQLHAPQWLILLLAHGVGGGINTVLPLIPQIGIIYLYLSFLENFGYIARAAFVIDRLMQFLGLPGKSFVPLIVGFGCNVPSVMGARTLNTPRERLMTIMMAPFMSCGARMAIFAIFAATFFGQNGATLVFSLYLLGIIVAILTGLILKHTLMRGDAIPFIMELPVYHVPHIKSLLLQTWQPLKGFVLRAGKVIVLASVLMGTLNSFTLHGEAADSFNQSALAAVSKILTPLLKPIGVHEDNWQATVGLISGAMAKEVVVGTLNTLYSAEEITRTPFKPDTFNLLKELSGAMMETWQSLQNVFSFKVLANPIKANKDDSEMSSGAMRIMRSKFGSAIAAYSYLIFVLLYMPCISVLGAIARESSRGWMLLSALWGVNIAYSLATLFYQAATFINHPMYSTMAMTIVIVANGIVIICLYFCRNRFQTGLYTTKSSPFCQTTASKSCYFVTKKARCPRFDPTATKKARCPRVNSPTCRF